MARHGYKGPMLPLLYGFKKAQEPFAYRCLKSGQRPELTR